MKEVDETMVVSCRDNVVVAILTLVGTLTYGIFLTESHGHVRNS